MEPQIRKLQELTARGVVAQIKSVHDPDFISNLTTIPKLWAELRSYPESASLQRVSLISTDLFYFAGVIVVDDTLSQLDKRVIPEGEYAEFTHRGPMSGIPHTMNYIYGSWFPKSGRRRGDGADISFPSDNNEVKILIPLV